MGKNALAMVRPVKWDAANICVGSFHFTNTQFG